MDPSQLLKEAHGLGRFALSRGCATQAVLTQQFSEYEQYLAGGGREQFSTMLIHRQILTPSLIQQYQAMTQSARRNMAPPIQSNASAPAAQGQVVSDYNPISATLTQSSRSPQIQSSRASLIHTPPPSMTQSSRSSSTAAELHQSQSRRPEIQIPGYTILETLGEGGMGVVYRATNAKKDHVAIKVIKNQFASQRAQKRFAREGDVMNKLEHPNIVKIYDTGTMETGDYIVMELLYGQPLDEVVAESRPSPTRALEIIVELCKGVAAAHDKDIIHRDLKPSNVMIVDENQVKVMDFGLAKDLNRETMLTQESAILGTPHYLSPEQAKGEHNLLGSHSDVFSIGVMMYELLTGERPFLSETAAGLYIRIAEFDPPSPNKIDPTVPKILSDIVMKALHKDLNDRYADARALSTDIERVLAGETFSVEKTRGSWLRSIRKHPFRSAAATLLILALGSSPFIANQWSEYRRGVKRLEASKGLEKSLLETIPMLKKGILTKDKSLIVAVKQLQTIEKQFEDFSKRDDDSAKALKGLLSKPKYVKIRAEAFVAYSQLLFDTNKFNESLQFSKEAVNSIGTENPFYAGALLLLAQSQFAMGQSKDALPLIESYLNKVESADKGLLVFKSRIHEDLRDLDKAITSLDLALKTSPDTLVLAEKARLLALKGDSKQSESIFKSLLKKFRNNRPLLLIRARSLEDQRRFDESLSLLARIQRVAPKDLSLRRARSRLFVAVGRLADAYNELTVALETIEAENVLLRIERAQLALDQGDVQRARDDLNRALSKTRTDDDVVAISLAFTRLFVMEGELEKARKKIGEAVQLYPRHAEVLKLALALSKDTNPEWIKRLVEIAPRDPWVLQQEALYLLEKQQPKIATQKARRMILRFPKSPRGYYVLAHGLKTIEPERSKEMFEKYSALRSESVRQGLGLAGRVHRMIGLKTKQSLALAKPILRWLTVIERQDCETWRLKAGRPKLSLKTVRKHLNKALQLNPHCPMSHNHRARLTGKDGVSNDAIAESAKIARPFYTHSPIDDRRLFRNRVSALIKQKKVPEALRVIDQ
ncbi:MAG: protein kinase, partial [Planctomycetota bacterium]|nr:protein kinase [Planctomycetota bacterium]